MGGLNAVNAEVEKQLPSSIRLSGETRFETAAEIIRFGYDNNEHIFISTGMEFADALTGSALAAKNNTAVLLVSGKKMSPRTELLISEQGMKTLKVFGGENAVSNATISELMLKMKEYENTIGGAILSDRVVEITNQEGIELEKAIKEGTYNSDGTIVIKVPNSSGLVNYKKGELLLVSPYAKNPLGLIVEVGTITSSNGKTQIKLGQPPLEDIFDNLKIDVDKDVGVSDIIGMDLSEGVTLVTGDRTPVSSMKELESTIHNIQMNGAITPQFLVNPEAIKLDLNYTFMENKEKNAKVQLVGNYELDASKVKIDINKTEFWEAGTIEAFNFEYKAKQKMNTDIIMSWNGDINDFEGKPNKRFEISGVDRKNRTTLASVTFNVGAITYHEKGMNAVPVGLTIFVVTTLDGKIELEGKLSVVDERDFHVKAEWKKGKKDFDYSSAPITKKSTAALSAKGNLIISKGVGLDVGLNLFSLVPAVIENDLKQEVNIEGNGKATWDFRTGNLMPELEGCIKANLDVGIFSTFKSRLKASFAAWEMGYEYKKEFFKFDLYDNDVDKCIPSGTVTGFVSNAVTKEKIDGVKVTAYKDGEFYRTARSNDGGEYEIELAPGKYKLKFSKLLYNDEFIDNVEVDTNGFTYNPELKLIYQDYLGEGTAKGSIKNALTGSPVPGSVIKIRKGMNTTTGEIVQTLTTDANGKYSAILKAGTYTGLITKDGYVESSINIISIGTMSMSNQDGTISPILDNEEKRIVLTWGNSPADLDSHLFGRYKDNSLFHVFYNYESAYEDGALLAVLDIDDTDSYGPETITIPKQNSGTYEYMVHDFLNNSSTDSVELSSSEAKVDVYQGNYLIKTFYVPTNKTGDLWKVFKLEGNEIISVNQITNSASELDANVSFSLERLEKKAK